MNELFKLKTEVEEEIRKDVKHIAIYADNLQRKDCMLVQKYVKTACRMYDVDCHVEGGVMNVLHNNPKLYQMYVPKENGKCPGWMAVELTNVLLCDEVWVFDNGYDNYRLDSRLDNVLINCEKKVRFLCKTPDGSSWDFYKCREVTYDSKGEAINDYYLVVDECGVVNEPQTVCKMRPISKEFLTDEEYDPVFNTLQLTQMMGNFSIKAAVRNDDELADKIKPLMQTGNEIIIDVLTKNECDEKTLKLCRAKLDFAALDAERLMNEYKL